MSNNAPSAVLTWLNTQIPTPERNFSSFIINQVVISCWKILQIIHCCQKANAISIAGTKEPIRNKNGRPDFQFENLENSLPSAACVEDTIYIQMVRSVVGSLYRSGQTVVLFFSRPDIGIEIGGFVDMLEWSLLIQERSVHLAVHLR
jgi:hypothetical protein